MAVPRARRSSSIWWTPSIAPTSRPRVGWTAIEHLRRRVDLTREDQALEVAAGQDAHGRVERRRHDRVRRSAVRRPCCARRRSSSNGPRASGGWRNARRMRLSTSDRFGALPTPADPRARAPTPAAIASRDGCAATSRPSISDPAGARPQTGDHLGELGLAVAGHGRDADDLTGPDLERRAAERRAARGRCPRGRRRRASTTRPGSTSVRLSCSRTGRPTISRARSARVTVFGSIPAAVTRPARMTVIRSAIDRTSPSLWLMKTTLRPPATIERSVANSRRSPGAPGRPSARRGSAPARRGTAA